MSKLLPVLSLTFALILVTPVLAQDRTGSTAFPSVKQNTGTSRLSLSPEMKDQIASREAVLKQKLQAFKDQRKAVVAQRISDNLNKVNKNVTDEQSRRLSKLSDILNRIEQRASASGSVASISATLTAAQTAIQTAQDAVTVQSQKDYTLTLTSELTAKTEVKTTRDKLFNDLKATHQLVLSAKDAVVAAFKAVVALQPDAGGAQ